MLNLLADAADSKIVEMRAITKSGFTINYQEEKL